MLRKAIGSLGLRGCVSALAVAAAVTLLTISAYGQTAETGALAGTLTDASGAVVPNVTVTITNIATGQGRTVMAGSNGAYSIGLLVPGSYRVHFEGTGFKAVDVPSVAVTVTETVTLNQQLEVGTQTQEVTVQGEAAEIVQTSSATLGTVMPSEAVTTLPLTTRNYTNLLGLSAGANAGVFNASTLGKGTSDIAVNGQSTSQNNVQMDGVSITNQAAAGTLTENGLNPGLGLVNPDAIQEFKIQTSLFDAGYGRNPGASVNVVTKSGTNEFHGTAFEFFRNTVLNANDFFRKISPPVNGIPNNGRQVLNQNQYGGAFGGPVKKDKFFFFTSFQETWQKNGVSAQGYSTPVLPPLPAGDRSNTAAFSAALANLYCGQSGAAGGVTIKSPTCSKPAGVGAVNINPVAINLLELKNPGGSYFIPGSSTGTNQNTTFSIPARFSEHQGVGNIDYVINAKNTLSGRYYYTDDPTQVSFSCGVAGGAPGICLPNTGVENEVKNHYAVLRLTSILTNNVVNEARVSYQRNLIDAHLVNPFTDTQVGIKPIEPSIDNLNFITVTGLFTIGSTNNYPSHKWINDLEVADQISWSHGKHTIRVGFEYERDQYNWNLVGLANGNLTFQSFPDFLLGLPGCAPGTSVAACTASGAAGTTNGTFTSNISSSGTIQAVVPPQGFVHGFREPFADAFIQDDFKVTSRLTLNLGLRWEYDGLPYDKYGDASNIWPSLIKIVPVPGSDAAHGTLAGFVVPSNFNFAANVPTPVGGLFQSNHKIATQTNPSITNFAPRIGFAWSPLASNRVVLRGGYGYFWDRVGQGNFNVPLAQGEPYANSVFQSGAANYFSTFAVPYQNTTLQWTPRWVNINTATQTGTSSNLSEQIMEENYPTPLVQEWNLNLQYEFAPSWVLELGYVGSHAIHSTLVTSRQLNEAQLANVANPINGITTNTVANASLRVPYLGFSPSGLTETSADADAKFNSLQATVRKRLSHGLTMQAAYTWSRAFNTTFAFDDPNVPHWGPNLLYRPQRFTVNYSWDLPLGKHEGFLDKVASGWNLSGVTVVQDGTPLTITDTRGGTIFGFGPGTPVTSTAQFAAGMGPANVATSGDIEARLGGSVLGGPGYFNKAAFATTPAIGNGTGYGNSGLGIILGPGQFNWDMSLIKTTRVGGVREGATLTFRAEFFNAFNHPQFNNPAVVDVSKSTFGQITSTSVNPRLVQFALKYAF